MITPEEQYNLQKKDVRVEEEERQKEINDNIQSLDGRSISELILLLDYWKAEREQNKKLDDLSTQKRREAFLWIEAIDIFIKSGKSTEPKETEGKSGESLTNSYIDAILRLKMSTPTLDDLARVTGISAATWSRHLNNEAFATVLKIAIQKKINSAKLENTQKFWRRAEVGVNVVVNRMHKRIRFSNNLTSSIDPLIPNDIHAGIRSLMKEEIGRKGEGKFSIDESDSNFDQKS